MTFSNIINLTILWKEINELPIFAFLKKILLMGYQINSEHWLLQKI